MLRLLVRNNNFKRFCHTHSKTNFCKLNDKVINDKIINIENDIIYIRDLTTYVYLFNYFMIPIILLIK